MLSTSGFELKSCIQRILRLDEIIPALLCLPLASNSASLPVLACGLCKAVQ